MKRLREENMATMNRAEIERLHERFSAAFNRDDLDGVMEFFTEDALYVQFNGAESRGKKEIREAFEPQFRGDYGKVRFHSEDLFVDEKVAKSLARWRCTVEIGRKPYEWRGLDIYCFEDGLIKEKRTYAQADIPLLKEI